MSDDIVTRLREDECYGTHYEPDDSLGCTPCEAADEIVRLRAIVEWFANYSSGYFVDIGDELSNGTAERPMMAYDGIVQSLIVPDDVAYELRKAVRGES